MTALRVDVDQLNRLTKPVRAETVCVVVAPTGYTETVEPPAVTAQELTHWIYIIL